MVSYSVTLVSVVLVLAAIALLVFIVRR